MSPDDSVATLKRDDPEVGHLVGELDLAGSMLVEDAASLITELRADLTVMTARGFLSEATQQGYRVLLCRLGEGEHRQCAALAGFRVLSTSRGKILMLEDLIVARRWRGRGLGAVMLAHVRSRAQQEACVRVELDTGNENRRAQRLYTSSGFEAIAVHFAAATAQPGPTVQPSALFRKTGD